MRAAQLHTCAQPPHVVDMDDPTPRTGSSLIAVSAAPVTPLDLLCASGTSYFGRPATPYVPGVQGVGVVLSSALHPAGTRVWFPTSAGMAPGDGGMAELAVVPDADLVPIGHRVDDTHLAALGLSAVAAWTSLLIWGGLQPGERVLVLGSSGIVGTVALQAARLNGAGAVFGAATSSWAGEAAHNLGADGFVQLSRGDDLDSAAARIRQVVGEVDLVIDPLCGVPASAALLCLAPRGRLVNLGSSAGPTATFSSAHLRSGSRVVRGYTNNDLTPEQRADAMNAIGERAAAGVLSVPFDVFPLDQAAIAWERQRSGQVHGRAVIDLRQS
ncbi:quinone oxidoreductase family protein [Terrabacter sp. 2RAF25]|uniref:quinone oxidoreductase family protein n=1 Tax=Terrabacter sp. 2RAF25 TaxID=3232998 RepID=UPI003F973F94